MKKEVMAFVCDNCGEAADPIELTKEMKKVKVFFPIGWSGLLRLSNLGPGDKLLLCTGCDKAVERALKQRQVKSKHLRPTDKINEIVNGAKK